MSDKAKKQPVTKPEPKTAAEMLAMRKSRNYWVLGLIVGLVVLFYLAEKTHPAKYRDWRCGRRLASDGGMGRDDRDGQP